MILKVSHNIRLNSDMNMSIATESVVDDETEAHSMGASSALLMKAYMDGFNSEFRDDDEDDE